VTLDLSDNKIRLEQLKNLKQLAELNLQYNQIFEVPEIHAEDFPSLETLNLSYNKINYMSIQSLMNLGRLKTLDISANSITQLP